MDVQPFACMSCVSACLCLHVYLVWKRVCVIVLVCRCFCVCGEYGCGHMHRCRSV